MEVHMNEVGHDKVIKKNNAECIRQNCNHVSVNSKKFIYHTKQHLSVSKNLVTLKELAVSVV